MDPAARPAPWRYATTPTPGRPHFGNKIAILTRASMGVGFMPWQRDVARVATEVDPDTGEWAYPTVVIQLQRQGGKTTLMVPANVHECMRFPDSYCWYTAQSRQAARDNFLRDAKPLMRSKVAPLVKLRRANGSEAIEVRPNGSEFRVFAPGSEELHGKTNRRVNIDEAWAFDALQGAVLMQGIVPTFTTTAGQVWIFSTAGTAESEFFLDWIAKGRASVEEGLHTGIAYFECSIPPDADPQDLLNPALREAFIQMILDNHPAYGYTLKLSALRAAITQMGPAAFARAYGNFWTPGADLPVLSATDYADAIEKRPVEVWPLPEPGAVALGFEVSQDETDCAIVAAWHSEGADLFDPLSGPKPVTLSVVYAVDGVHGLIAKLAELAARWQPIGIGYNNFGPAAVAANEARDAGIGVLDLAGKEYATACAALRSALARRRLTIQPDPAFDTAQKGLARRPLGNAWVWDRRASAASIATIVAATTAKWILDHHRPFEIM